MTTEELVEKAKDQRKRDRLNEALISAQRAAELAPDNAEAWWQVALNTLDTAGPAAAEKALEKTLELAPRYAYGWYRFGKAMQDKGDAKRAQAYFERAVEEDADQEDALLELAKIYAEANDDDGELRTLAALDRLITLSSYTLNRLGILHYQKKHFDTAIECYRRAAAGSSDPASLYNIGLAYNQDEVGQTADAIDTWRLTLDRYPDYAKADEALYRALPSMVAMRATVLSERIQVLSPEQRYTNYVNPLELLGLGFMAHPDNLDSKTLQRAKKTLLQEIELEDGRVSGMPGLLIDRSRAIALCEELSDVVTRTYHHHVLENSALLEFLNLGRLEHFLVDPDKSPLPTIELLEKDAEGFAKWLSPIFAAQFDLVLTKAIESRNALAIECLLAGRRWVVPVDHDRCFEASRRQVAALLVPLHNLSIASKAKKPALSDVEAVLKQGSLSRILKSLPIAFHDAQAEAAQLVRTISLHCFAHDDSELAKAVLELSRDFTFKSPVLKHQLAEDIETLRERIAAERQHESKLTMGERPWEITKEGAKLGTQFIGADRMDSMRWGILVDRSGTVATNRYSMTLAGAGEKIQVAWQARADDEKQLEFFSKVVDAALNYLVPPAVDRVLQQLARGKRVSFGNVAASDVGVDVQVNGWFSTKVLTIPWARLAIQISNGDLILSDDQVPKARCSLPLHSTDNAMVLAYLAHGKKQ